MTDPYALAWPQPHTPDLFFNFHKHHLEFRLMDRDQGVLLTDDLRIHFLELPKFGASAEELDTPLETWLYFLRHAERLDTESLPGCLDTPEIRQAMENLTMLSHMDIQREIYEGRIKARRDQLMWDNLENDWREYYRAEGRTEGRNQGLLVGRVQLAQKVLRREVTPRTELEAMPMEALEALAADLERELLA